MRRTHTLVHVAAALMNKPFGRHWGYDLSRSSGTRSGTLYPLLSRMLDKGWLTDGWEDIDPSQKRPRRRYYQLTEIGRDALQMVLKSAAADPRFTIQPLKEDPA
jgi:PadR family transcriptional regulator, regulatory protein PadR